MNKTKIEWCDYTINPVKGLCPMACYYCYARRMYKRFKWNPEIWYDSTWWQDLKHIKTGSRVFIGSTMELFYYKDNAWIPAILNWCNAFNKLTYIFLTKLPGHLPKKWPDNCWVGATATNMRQYKQAILGLSSINAKVKFISFEPLLEHIPVASSYSLEEINWLIIGQQTPISKKTEPKIEWITEIVEAADKAHIPVFLKDNLSSLVYKNKYNGQFALDRGLLTWGGKLRQEFPEV